MISLTDRYLTIKGICDVQVYRLQQKGSSGKVKADQINQALDRIREVVFFQVSESDQKRITIWESSSNHPKIYNKAASLLDLSTYQAMLNAKIAVVQKVVPPWTEGGLNFYGSPECVVVQISLSEALNIARNNPFNHPAGLWGPIWGKSESLRNIENSVFIST